MTCTQIVSKREKSRVTALDLRRRARGNPKFSLLGERAKIMLRMLINEHMVTEIDLAKAMSTDRTGVDHHYRQFIVFGFNIRKKTISLFKHHRNKFVHGVKPVETVYYI